MTIELLTCTNGQEKVKVKIKASSTLNNLKEFSAKHVLSEDDDTCWNSDSGESQVLTIDLGRACVVRELVLTFQGGFVGRRGLLELFTTRVPAPPSTTACTLTAPFSAPSGTVASAAGDGREISDTDHRPDPERGDSAPPCMNQTQSSLTNVFSFEPVDDNSRQRFTVPLRTGLAGRFARLTLSDSSDFYGRVTLYTLQLWGESTAEV